MHPIVSVVHNSFCLYHSLTKKVPTHERVPTPSLVDQTCKVLRQWALFYETMVHAYVHLVDATENLSDFH